MKKEDENWPSHMAGRPPWSADLGVAPLYLTPCTGSPWHSPCPSSTSFTSCSSSPLLSLLLFFSKFIRKRRKIFPCFAFLVAFHLHFVFTFFSLQECVCGGILPRKNGFVVRHRPQERFCGVLSPTRTIFVRGDHALQGLLTLG